MGNPQITEYSYLSGDVVHLKGDAAHDVNTTQLDYLKDYFLDCADVLTIADYNLDTINVYPNPTNSKITVTGAFNQTIEYSIFNVFGQLVLSGSGTSDTLQIDLSELDSQVYFLKINNKVIKIIKNK